MVAIFYGLEANVKNNEIKLEEVWDDVRCSAKECLMYTFLLSIQRSN